MVDGVLELATGRRLGGNGQAFPITERHCSLKKVFIKDNYPNRHSLEHP